MCVASGVLWFVASPAASTARSTLAPTSGRARPAIPVILVADGAEKRVLAPFGTVRGLLGYVGIRLRKYDRVAPAPGQALAPGMVVRVTRVDIQVHRETRTVPAPTFYLEDATLLPGTRVVRQRGADRVIERTRRVYLKDGAVTLEKTVDERLASPPRPTVIALAPGAAPEGAVLARRMEATAYEPGPRSCGRWANGLTATGARATKGVVAVDPRVIPLGTWLYIEGYGCALAADVGSAIKGDRIDLCYDTVAECLQFGRREVWVWVLDGEPR